MKKTLLFFLILVVFIAIGQSKAYAVKKIEVGDLLIYNETPLGNAFILNTFNNYMSKNFKDKKIDKKIYYWIVKASFKVPANHKGQIKYAKDCFATAKALRFFKPNKYTIRHKSSGYYVIVDNHEINLKTKKYTIAKDYLAGKKASMIWINFSAITNSYGQLIDKTCNHKYFKTKAAAEKLLKPRVEGLHY